MPEEAPVTSAMDPLLLMFIPSCGWMVIDSPRCDASFGRGAHCSVLPLTCRSSCFLSSASPPGRKAISGLLWNEVLQRRLAQCIAEPRVVDRTREQQGAHRC